LKNLSGKDYFIGIIEISFINNLIQILHYNYIKNLALKQNLKIESTKLSENFLNPNWGKIKNFYNSYHYPYNKLQRIFRKIIKSYFFNRHLPLNKIILGIILNKKNISLGSFDELKKEFIFKKKDFYSHIEWIDLINNSRKYEYNNTILEKKNKNFSNKVIEPMLKLLVKSTITNKYLEGLSCELICSTWKNRINDLNKIQLLLKNLETPKKLLVTECGNPFHKVIAASFKGKGTTIINFNHGNNMGLIDQSWNQTYMASICDYYVYETNTIKNAYDDNRDSLTLDFKENIKYISATKSKHSKQLNYLSFNKKVSNKVMLMGFPMNTTRYTADVHCFFHYKLKLEMHLLEELKKSKYNLVYKAHPDRILELGAIYRNDVAEIISKKFEKVWMNAGVLIFTYVSTTTFGFALSLPIPIVLVESENIPWIKSRKKILEKRVSFIPNYNNLNYKQINYETLNKAIKEAKKKVNYNAYKQLIGKK
jgi:hypothetical protein